MHPAAAVPRAEPPRGQPGPLPRVAARRSWEAAAVLVSALFIGVYTWPASIAPASWVWGGPGDALGNAFLFTWIVDAFRFGHPLTVDRSIAIPFGDNLGALPHEPVFFVATLVLGRLVGAVAALNLVTFAGGPLAAWAMYRLLLHLTGSGPASFFGGVAFGCSTFVLHSTFGEPTLVQVWIFPLVAWALLAALERPRPLRVAGAAAAVALGATVNFYFSLFAAIACAVLVVAWALVVLLRERRLPARALLAAAVAGAAGGLLAGGLYVASIGDLQRPAQAVQRPATNLDLLAPDALDVLLPPSWNPWLGGAARAHYQARLARTGEFSDLSEMSVAAPVLLLAPLGALLLLTRRARLTPGRRRTAELGALLAVGAAGVWLTVPPGAMPPHLHRLSLQLDIHNLLPQYEHFSRAILLVELGLLPLAAIAVAWLLRGRPRLTGPLVVLLVAAVLVESYEHFPNPALPVTAPPQDAWLAAHPGSYAVADLPMLPPDSGGNEHTFLFYQRFDGHPRLNGDIVGTESESMREELRDPGRPGVARRLATLGVRYLAYYPDVLASYDRLTPAGAAPYYGYLPAGPDYQLEARFPGGGAVYSDLAAPANAFAFYASGFGPVAPAAGGGYQRALAGDQGSIDVYAREPATIALHFRCQGGPGTLVLDQAGKELGSWPVSTEPAAVSATAGVGSGVSRLGLRWLPGPRAGAAQAPLACTLIELS